MKNELKTRPCLKPVFEIISNTDANLVICISIKQQQQKKNQTLNNSDLITHFTKQTLNLDHLLITLFAGTKRKCSCNGLCKQH